MDKVHLRVLTLTGDVAADCEVDPYISTASVKALLSAEVVRSPMRARLLLGPQVLDDSARLCDVAVDLLHRRKIELTLICLGGSFVVSGSDDGSVRVWDLDDCSAAEGSRSVLLGHIGCVRGIEADRDSQRALCGTAESNVLRLWDVENGLLLHELQGHAGPIYGMSVDWAQELALTWGEDCTLRVWDLRLGSMAQQLRGHAFPVCDAEVSFEHSRALSWGAGDDGVWVWNTSDGTPLCTLGGFGGSVERVEVAWDEQRALCLDQFGTLMLWDLVRGEPLLDLGSPGAGAFQGFAASLETGQVLVWGSRDGAVCHWQGLRSVGRAASSCLTGHTDRVCGAEVDWDAGRAVSWDLSGALRLWTLPCGPTAGSSPCGVALGAHSLAVGGLLVDWDCQQGLSWGDDGALRVWSLDPLAPGLLHMLLGHCGGVWSASADWKRMRALSWSFLDPCLRLWDLVSGTELGALRFPGQEPASGALGTDIWNGGVEVDWKSGRAVSWRHGSKDLWAWDLERGALLRVLSGHEDIVSCVVLP